MKIAFFLSNYPVFSETFITNEIFWLQKSKIEGKIWYEISENKEKQPNSKNIKFSTKKIPYKILSKKNITLIIKAHFYWIKKNPIEYFKYIFIFPIKIKWINIRSIIKAPLVANQLKKYNPDLIYNHDSDNAYYLALLCSKLNNIPLITIFHTYHLFHRVKKIKTKIKESDAVIFQSEYSKKYVEKQLKNSILNKKLHVISSAGIDTNFFKKKKDLFQKEKIIKLITIGRLEETKGFNFLIQAISILKKQNFKVKCKIVGDGSQKKKLINLRNSFNLIKEINFLGKVPHNQKLIKYLSEAEMFILPSVISQTGDRDMQPNVVKEAMSMELLTIASRLGGINEVISNKKNGFLLENTSPEYIANKIKKVWLLSSKEKINIGTKARKTIINKFESQKINQQLISLFSKYEK